MELIFFLTAHTVLWFRFMTKEVLIMHGVLVIAEQCLYSIKAFFAGAGQEAAVGHGQHS